MITIGAPRHTHVNAGACRGHVALGFDDCDHCCIAVTRSDGYRTTTRLYCIDCAVRLGIAPDAARCDRN